MLSLLLIKEKNILFLWDKTDKEKEMNSINVSLYSFLFTHTSIKATEMLDKYELLSKTSRSFFLHIIKTIVVNFQHKCEF